MTNPFRYNYRICITLSVLFVFLLAFNPIISAQNEEILPDSLSSTIQDSLTLESTPISATNIIVQDTPDDAGNSITINWDLSPNDTTDLMVKQYRVLRAPVIDGQPGEFELAGEEASGKVKYTDGNVTDDNQYFYKIQTVNFVYNDAGEVEEYYSESDPIGPVNSYPQWFKSYTINTLIGTGLLVFFIIYFIQQAKAGKELFIRKLAGMEAVHEAVGRATEMGRKIFFIPGIGDMDNMQTIAAMTILGRVAELTAEYETYLDVPVCRSLVMVTGREVVKEAYSKVGRPDSYKEDQVHYLTDDQFGYAAGVDGMFVREEPATIFFMGQFYAESLILAETGNSIGAIQIAGTAMPAQLPFFVAACDYTLIGEELFAASAYLSKEPKLLGSLKGQDIGKGLILICLIIGLILETFNIYHFANLFLVK